MSDPNHETYVGFTNWLKIKTPTIVEVIASIKNSESTATEYLEALCENAYLQGWVNAMKDSNRRIREG